MEQTAGMDFQAYSERMWIGKAMKGARDERIRGNLGNF